MTTRMTMKHAGLALIAGFLIHNADHARRGLDATSEPVVWGGFFALLVAAIVLTLVFTDHPLAPAGAAAAGFALATGVAAVHLLPDWGPMSDSLPSGDVDGLTWLAVLCEVGAAALLGAVGLRRFRADDYQIVSTPAPVLPS